MFLYKPTVCLCRFLSEKNVQKHVGNYVKKSYLNPKHKMFLEICNLIRAARKCRRPSNHSAAPCKRLRVVVGPCLWRWPARSASRAGGRTGGRSGRRFAPPSAVLESCPSPSRRMGPEALRTSFWNISKPKSQNGPLTGGPQLCARHWGTRFWG